MSKTELHIASDKLLLALDYLFVTDRSRGRDQSDVEFHDMSESLNPRRFDLAKAKAILQHFGIEWTTNMDRVLMAGFMRAIAKQVMAQGVTVDFDAMPIIEEMAASSYIHEFAPLSHKDAIDRRTDSCWQFSYINALRRYFMAFASGEMTLAALQ